MTGQQQMHVAVRAGERSTVETLLADGANINGLFYGWTPLQLAIEIGQQDMACLLIGRDCDVYCHHGHSKPPVHQAVLKKQVQVVEALLEKGVSGEVVLDSGHTPLTYAVDAQCTQLVQVLVQGGVDVNRANSQGQTPMYLAAKSGQTGVVHVLLTAGADINRACKQDGGSTPLIAAAANEHTQIISLLSKQQGCELDRQDVDGWTALWHAYSNSRDDTCAVLLRAGASKHLPNAEGTSVLQDAKDNEDEVMLEVFQKYNNMV